MGFVDFRDIWTKNPVLKKKKHFNPLFLRVLKQPSEQKSWI